MTLQQLQYIVALDNHRHFVRAADSCFVAQPTLTLQVKKLESQINLVIFDRSSQPLKPTPMGELFIAKARQILRDIEQLKHLVNSNRNEVSGTFRLGIIPSLSQYLLPLFMPEFSQAFPETVLEVKEWQSDAIIEGIQKDLLDIGILATPLEEPSLREVPIFYEPFLIFANEHDPILSHKSISPSDLEQEELWLLEKGHCFRNQSLNICAKKSNGNGKLRNIQLEGGSLETLKRMVSKTSGYTLIPELSYNKHTDQHLTRRFREPQPVREVSLVMHKSFTKELLINELRKSIMANTPKSFRKNTKFHTVKWR